MAWAWLARNWVQVGPLRRGAGSTPGGVEDLPDRAGGDLVAQSDQLAVDAPVAPGRVLARGVAPARGSQRRRSDGQDAGDRSSAGRPGCGASAAAWPG